MTLSAALHGGIFGTRWTPLELGSSLAAWHDASVSSSITNVSGRASQWNDISGNGLHFTQSNSTNRPTIVTNGLEFGASNVRLMFSNLSGSTRNRAVAIVFRLTSDSGEQVFVGSGTEGTSGAWSCDANIGDNTRMTSSGVALIASQTTYKPVLNTTHIGFWWTDATTWRLGLDGNTVTGSNSTTLSSGRTTRIGGYHDTGLFPVNGTIHEMVFTNSVSTTDQALIEGYLAWKWGLTGSLPAGHPFKNIRP